MSDNLRRYRAIRDALIQGYPSYTWVVYLGAFCVQDGWVNIIHRGDRCDLSLFQLGLRLLNYLLNEGFTIPVAFYIST